MIEEQILSGLIRWFHPETGEYLFQISFSFDSERVTLFGLKMPAGVRLSQAMASEVMAHFKVRYGRGRWERRDKKTNRHKRWVEF